LTNGGGPATQNGKAVERWNATRHGISSTQPVVPGLEEQEDWESHLEGIVENLSPVGHLEVTLAERVALLSWRLHRVTRFETGAIAISQETIEDDIHDRHRFLSALKHKGLETTHPEDIRFEAKYNKQSHSDLRRLPVNPERMVEDAAFPVFAESAAVLEEVADALEDGDARRVQRAYVKAREIDARVAGLKEAVAAGRETARLAPPRRKSLGHMELYTRAADQIDLTVRDVRALARAALSVVQPEAEDPAPQRLLAAIRTLARATESLAAYLQTSGDPPEETRRLALEAATEASTLLEEDEDLASNLGVNALVDQIHSSAVDLIGGTGMDRSEALRALEEATGRASW
jgi:hypothetical protein